MFRWQVNPHFGPFHVASNVPIIAAFFLLSSSWIVLCRAQRRNVLAISGPCARIRHPQSAAFVVILFGFLLRWPTLVTLLIFSILVFVHARLAHTEELCALKEFGDEYRRYRDRTSFFIPLGRRLAVANACVASPGLDERRANRTM